MQKQLKTQEFKLDFLELENFLSKHSVNLWSGGSQETPFLELNDNIIKSLAFARRCGTLQVGLELIETLLAAEENGLSFTRKHTATETTSSCKLKSVSRILLLSSDGSERFYRHSETILNQHSQRLLGIKLNATANVLGQIFYGREGKNVKALFVNRKDSVLRVLSSLM